jgi:hypothetical protein
MRAKVSWLILTAVTAVVLAGVVDAVRGSSSNPEAAQAGEPVIEPSTHDGTAGADSNGNCGCDRSCRYERTGGWDGDGHR